MIKSKLNLIYILLIICSLIIISSANENPKRFLEIDSTLETSEVNTTEEENSSLTSITEDPGSYLLGWFVIFFFIGLYIICSMKRYPEISNRADDVYKFMFFANNGILVAASVNIFDIKNLIIDSSPFGLSALVFIIGCIYYICKYCQICTLQFADHYFDCDYLGELFKIPCFIWNLRVLSDPCCRSESYTVTTYADGHTESTECCHHMWNCFILIIKRLAIIFTMLSYYIFLLFFLIFWLIAKCIYLMVLKCKEEEEEAENVQNPQTRAPINSGVNIPNIIGSVDELNNGERNGQQHIENQTTIDNQNNIGVITNNMNGNNFGSENININRGVIYSNHIVSSEIIINQYTNNNNQFSNNNPNEIMNLRPMNVNSHGSNITQNNMQNIEHIAFSEINQNNENNDSNDNNYFSSNVRQLPEVNEEEQNEQIQKQNSDKESESNLNNEDSINENNSNEVKKNEVESQNNMDDAPAAEVFDEQI